MRNLLLMLLLIFGYVAPAASQVKSPPRSGKVALAQHPTPNAQRPTPLSFVRDVSPILTRRGCNMGACHGSQYGKGGFKLSLAGFDPDLDYINLVKQMRGRRVTLAEPTKSLFLTKPLGTIPHGGGQRFKATDPDYLTLLRWLKEGAHGVNSEEAPLVSLSVSPVERVVPTGSAPYPLKVTATYGDGIVRDVTAHARINSLNEGIASATPDGIIKSIHAGQTSVMIRYGGLAAVSAVVVPYGMTAKASTSRKVAKSQSRSLPMKVATLNAQRPAPNASSIDALVAIKQTQLHLTPSPLCDDATFLRRVSLDLTGTVATPEEVRAFLRETAADKRARLVDRLLASPAYADYWSLKWADLLRVHRTALGVKGMWSFDNWIHTELRDNVPLDRFVRELLTAKGSAFTNGPANYYRVAREPQDLAEMTSQVFLGVRMQCAKCHQHPFERWSQRDYYQFAAFFARVRTKDSKDFGLFGQEQIVRISDDGEVRHPKTNERMFPTPLGVKLVSLKPASESKSKPTLATNTPPPPDPDASGDRRVALADWLTSKDTRLFARNFANRYWGYLFGHGIVNPIDDLRVTNPASNPALLDYLTDYLLKNDYNVKALLRLICLSNTYGRSSQATANNREDEVFCTHYLPKRLPAETLLDAVDSACGTQERYDNLPLGTHATQLPDPQIYNEFLETFGRPQRTNSCECERTSDINLAQTLRMLNGDTVNNKVRDERNRLHVGLKSKRPDYLILDEMYLSTLGRVPTLKEQRIALGVVAFSSDKRQGFEDVLLTLLNSKEFLFVR